jgi:hypothetical protein
LHGVKERGGENIAMRDSGWTRAGALLFAVLLGAILFVNLFRPFGDPDFFWHLKTGEWIWQHRALPAEDPFAYTTPAHPAGTALFILTSYWGSQVLYHLLHLEGGFPALLALRFAIAGLLVLAMYCQFRGNRLVFLSLLALALVVLGLFPLERPQAFSFVCFAALFSLLSSFRGSQEGEGRRPPWYALPGLMIVWANLHGGFLLGQALILAFVALEGIKFLHPGLRPLTREGYRRLVVAGALGLGGSLCNPNTWHGLAFFAASSPPDWWLNVEYQSTVYVFRSLHSHRMIAYWLLLLLALVGFAARRDEPDLSVIAILAGLGLLSFMQTRYVPFFLVAAVPTAAANLSRWEARRWLAAGLAGLAVCAGLFFTWKDRHKLLDAGSGRWISAAMPAGEADFIVSNGLRGNMYNHWVWGGYLIWRLAPERKVFVDGRVLDLGVLSTASSIDNAVRRKDTGAPAWKTVFEKYGILYAVVPFVTFDGERLPLADALLKDPEWLPYASNPAAAVFVKDTAENGETIRRFDLRTRKKELVDPQLALLDRWISLEPRNVAPLLKKGELLMGRSLWLEARRTYEDVLRIDPGNTVARERLRQLPAAAAP